MGALASKHSIGLNVFLGERYPDCVDFDGSRASLGGKYGFDPTSHRTVAVDASAITEILGKVYGEDRLVQELLGTSQRRSPRRTFLQR